MDAHKLVDEFIRPFLKKNFPNADLVILAGSFGRALRNGDYGPQASSDADLIVVYKDLEKGGFKTAEQIYLIEDVGSAMGGASREMMIDCNVHDFTSLTYHMKNVREYNTCPFMPVMIAEGVIVLDRTGIGPVLQRQAQEFVAAGPCLPERAAWQAETANLSACLADIRAAQSVEEKRMLGVLAMVHVAEYGLKLNSGWTSGSNQAYRSYERYFPALGKSLSDAFSDLIRHGDSRKAEVLMGDFLREGAALAAKLPEKKEPLLYPVAEHVPAEVRADMDRMFCKFMAEHLGTSFDKSLKRGELAYLENLSATVNFIKRFKEQEASASVGNGLAALRWLSTQVPDLMPVALQAVDTADHKPVEKLTDEAFKSVGGIHYHELVNYYADDLARVFAVEKAQKHDTEPLKKSLRARFTP